jgi:uncharacterized membrane protein
MKTHTLAFFQGMNTRLKRQQRKSFMEKKIKRTKSAKSVSNSNEEKTITVTVFVSLIIVGALLLYLIFFTPAEKEVFSAIYLLDSEKQAENFPKTVVLGENNTFSLWVGVENQNGTTMDYSVLVKLDDGSSPLDPCPAETTESFNRTLADRETWEFPVTINIDRRGSNIVIFELWFFNATKNDWDYTGNWVNLSIEAVQK